MGKEYAVEKHGNDVPDDENRCFTEYLIEKLARFDYEESDKVLEAVATQLAEILEEAMSRYGVVFTDDEMAELEEALCDFTHFYKGECTVPALELRKRNDHNSLAESRQ
jgi:hypothetical protein|nr:MAG TPA: hypothetical protein [Caudoviricetes sp.]